MKRPSISKLSNSLALVNMRTLRRHLVSILLALSVLSGAAWAQSTTGGDPVVPRQGVDLFSNFYFLDTNHPFGADGTVNHWEIYTLNNLKVALVIYREKGGVFFEVGRSQVVTPTSGYNLFSLNQPIQVKAGDFVGAYFPGQGSISYTPDPAFSAFEYDLQAAVLSTNPNAPSSTDFQISSYRHYSLRAFGGSGSNNNAQ